MFSDVSVSGPLWRSVSDVPLQRIRINVFVCRIRISATRVHLLLPNHTGPYQLPVTLYCMWNSYHCNSLSLSLSFLCSSRIPPASSLLHSAIVCVCLLRFTACYLAYRFFAWFLYPKPPWSLSVGRFVCDYSRARFSSLSNGRPVSTIEGYPLRLR